MSRWVVMTEFGPIAHFATQAEAQALADIENAEEAGSCWVLYVIDIKAGRLT